MAYAFTGKDFPGSQGDDTIGGLPANVLTGSSRKQYLLLQDVLMRHPISRILRVFLDEQDIIRGEISGTAVFELGQPGVASETARVFSGSAAFNVATEKKPGYGNRTGHRDADTKFDGLAYATGVMRNQTTKKNAYHYQRVPTARYLIEAGMPKSVEGTDTLSLTADGAYSNSPPLCLLSYYTNQDFGMGFPESELAQETLRSIVDAQTYTDSPVQGAGGMATQAYPAMMNRVEGTNYATYEQAFAARGYQAPNQGTAGDSGLVREFRNFNPFGGYVGGWERFGPQLQDYAPAATLKRCEFNGPLIPDDNMPDVLQSILQTMPGSVFPRSRATGQRVLRLPKGNMPLADQSVGRIQFRNLISLEFRPAEMRTKASQMTMGYQDVDSASRDSTYTFPDLQRDGRDTPAFRYIDVRLSGRRNNTAIQAHGIDNRYHAANAAWTGFWLSWADEGIISKGYDNHHDEVGEIITVENDPDDRAQDEFVFITA